MARTKRNAMNIEEARNKIRTTQLVNRLTNHVLGKVKMESTQVTAALGLLKKALPDLTAAEITSDITINNVLRAPYVDPTTDEWQARNQTIQ